MRACRRGPGQPRSVEPDPYIYRARLPVLIRERPLCAAGGCWVKTVEKRAKKKWKTASRGKIFQGQATPRAGPSWLAFKGADPPWRVSDRRSRPAARESKSLGVFSKFLAEKKRKEKKSRDLCALRAAIQRHMTPYAGTTTRNRSLLSLCTA